MPSTVSTVYADYIEGKLISAVGTGTTTGVTVKIKQVNGATPTWPTAAHRIKIVQKTATNNKVEKIGVAAGTTQSGQTVTLGTLTRALSLSDGTNFSGSAGTAQSFAAGADVFITWDNHDAAQSAKLDIANTFTGALTMSGGVTLTGTTATLKLPELTTTQRDALTATEGMLIKNSTTGTIQSYTGGAWASVGTDATANASTTVAGKVEEATAAELGAGTTAGGTGARLFINPSLAVKTSSGAGDENKLPVLNSSGQLANGFLGSGTANSSSYLRGDRTWTSPLSSIGFFGDGSDGAVTWSVSTNLNPATEKQYTTATLDSGQTLSVSSVNTPLVIHNTGDVTINGTVDLNGKGGGGGTGTSGAGTGGNGTAGNSIVSGWTNGAGTGASNSSDPGGGGAGASWDADGGAAATGGTEGTPGTKLDSDKYAFLSSILRGAVCGGGGGGGSANNSGGAGNAGAGGAGGGALVWCIGGNLTLGASSIIRANGDNGTAGSGTAAASGQTAGGGGGGGGGMILVLVAGTITNSGVTVSATGGTGGNGHSNGSGNSGFKGGDSVNGKVIIYSLSTGTLITA